MTTALHAPAAHQLPASHDQQPDGPRTDYRDGAVAELLALIQSDGLSPEVAALVARRHPHQLDRLIAHLHQHGNAFVDETLALVARPAGDAALPTRADDAGAAPARPARPARALPDVATQAAAVGATAGEVGATAGEVGATAGEVGATAGGEVEAALQPEVEPDYAASRAWNRAHVRNVVRFDYATKHRYADQRRNGELDVYRVAQWQREHQAAYPDLEVTGMVDELTCEIAEGRPPQPRPPKPHHPPSVELLPTIALPNVPDGTLYPAGRRFHVPFEVQARPGTQIWLQGYIPNGIPEARRVVTTDGDGHATGTLEFNAQGIGADDRPEAVYALTIIGTESPAEGGRSGPVIQRRIRIVSAPPPIW